jgi:hypothetical protein
MLYAVCLPMKEGEQHPGVEVPFTAKPEQQPGTGDRRVLQPYHWQEELNYVLDKEGDAPGGKEFPDFMLYRISNAVERAGRAGDTRAEQDLNRLEDAYVFSAFPFLSAKGAMTEMYYEAGWLTPREREEKQVIVLPDELYHYHTQLLDKANIPELYQLTGQGEVPYRRTKKGHHAVPIQRVLTQMRRIAEGKRLDWKHPPTPKK